MPFSTFATPEARPVANYKMATRMEGGRLVYVSGQVAWDASGNIVGKGDVGAQARQTFRNLRQVLVEVFENRKTGLVFLAWLGPVVGSTASHRQGERSSGNLLCGL